MKDLEKRLRESKRTSNLPWFNDYRVTNDGAMVADIGFKRQLWALDPELDIVWDWGSKKWEIWRFPGQKRKIKKLIDDKAHHVMTVQTKDRTFRELGADILLKLQWGDTTKWSTEELMAYFDKLDDNVRRAKEKEFQSYFHDVTLETFDYVRNVLKVQVPKTYGLKESDHKYLLEITKPKPQNYLIKLPQGRKVINAIGGQDA
jgi:hypothetical protein